MMTFSRKSTFSAGTAIGFGIILGIGCSNDVVTNDGSGGAKGTTGSVAVTNATVTHASTTVTSGNSVAASTTGGNTVCDQACSKAANCGFDICAQFPLDCSNALAECASGCINNATCDQIQSVPTQHPDPTIVSCIVACQMGGTGGAGGGGSTCASCIQTNQCFPAGCLGDASCQTWGQCALACGNQGPDCYTACDNATPAASAYYDQFYGCGCTHCQNECATQIAPCTHGPQGTTSASSSSTTTTATSSGTAP